MVEDDVLSPASSYPSWNTRLQRAVRLYGPSGSKRYEVLAAVIVLDIMLPGLDGVGVLRRLRQGGNRRR